MSDTLHDMARKLVASILAAEVHVAGDTVTSDNAAPAGYIGSYGNPASPHPLAQVSVAWHMAGTDSNTAGWTSDASYATQVARQQRQAAFARKVSIAVAVLYKAFEMGLAKTTIGRLQADIDPQSLADVRYEVATHPKSDSLWLEKKAIKDVLAALDHANAIIDDMAQDGLLAIQQAAYARGKADGARAAADAATEAAAVCLHGDEVLSELAEFDTIADIAARMEKAIAESVGASKVSD